MDSPVEKDATITQKEPPRVLALTEAGITTAKEFAAAMSALMSDVIAGRIHPKVAAAASNAGGKLLKVVEMQYKYGTDTPNNQKELKLIG